MKAAILYSSGLDCFVATGIILNSMPDIKELHFLMVHYNAKASLPETKFSHDSINWFADKYPNVSMIVPAKIDLSYVASLGGSTLTSDDLEVETGIDHYNTDCVSAWVPARNLAMLGLAASYCDVNSINYLVMGLNKEDGEFFKDNSKEFYDAYNIALKLGTQSNTEVLMPVGEMMKADIWRKAKELSLPLDLSWSCYNAHKKDGKYIRCGQCPPCIARQHAAAANQETDTVDYLERIQ